MAVLVKYSFQITSLQLVLGTEEQTSSEFRNNKEKSVLNGFLFPGLKGAEPCWASPGRTDRGLWAAALIQQVASEHPQVMPHLGPWSSAAITPPPPGADASPASLPVPKPRRLERGHRRGGSSSRAVLCCAGSCLQPRLAGETKSNIIPERNWGVSAESQSSGSGESNYSRKLGRHPKQIGYN